MNNQPAFPVSLPHLPIDSRAGMTLRDYFAARAMPAIYKQCMEISAANNGPPTPRDEDIAAWAYELADAMLRAREES